MSSTNVSSIQAARLLCQNIYKNSTFHLDKEQYEMVVENVNNIIQHYPYVHFDIDNTDYFVGAESCEPDSDYSYFIGKLILFFAKDHLERNSQPCQVL